MIFSNDMTRIEKEKRITAPYKPYKEESDIGQGRRNGTKLVSARGS